MIEAKALRKMRHPTRLRRLEGFLDAEGEAAWLWEEHLPIPKTP